MPIVDCKDLISHARAGGYAVPAMKVDTIGDTTGVLEAAKRLNAPCMLRLSASVEPGIGVDSAMPAIEALASTGNVPVALCFDDARAPADVMRAVKLGFNAVALPRDTPADGRRDAMSVARLCGIAVATAVPEAGAEEGMLGDEIDLWEINLAGAADGPVDRPLSVAIESTAEAAAVRETPASNIAFIVLRRSGIDCAEAFAALAEAAGARDRAADVLRSSRLWTPVEHVVAFNAPDLDPAAVASLFARGARELGGVPGVRSVRYGRAVDDGARYRYCWFIRLASAAAAESYKRDPLHIAFADAHFRPVAGDRLTTDYVLDVT